MHNPNTSGLQEHGASEVLSPPFLLKRAKEAKVGGAEENTAPPVGGAR